MNKPSSYGGSPFMEDSPLRGAAFIGPSPRNGRWTGAGPCGAWGGRLPPGIEVRDIWTTLYTGGMVRVRLLGYILGDVHFFHCKGSPENVSRTHP